MSALELLLGSEVINGSKQSIAVSSLAKRGSYIAIYFSAHWCPPCRGFTPVLAKFYENVKQAGKPLEIIFVSSDKDEAQFNEYFATMPWLALPFSDRSRKNAISSKYGVSGIPTLILLDAETGEVINANARSEVTQDPNGAKFPWSS